MWLVDAWYRDARWLIVVRPLAWLFSWLATRRRRKLLGQVVPASVPVIVVGNITVGGTGKTPVVLALIDVLQRRGMRVAVLSRGYGGRARQYPLWVDGDTDVRHCGDEVLMLRRHFNGPLVVDPQRARGLQALVAQGNCDVVISDDGLQHYALWRDIELVVVDAARGLGNGRYLPAGPLREPPSRLREVDYVLVNGAESSTPAWHVLAQRLCHFELVPASWVNVKTGQRVSLAYFMMAYFNDGHPEVFALAGIGNPGRFFATLEGLGIFAKCRVFADHHAYVPADLSFAGQHLLLMTEKDAVKCERFAETNCWYLAVQAQLPAALTEYLGLRLDSWQLQHAGPALETQGD